MRKHGRIATVVAGVTAGILAFGSVVLAASPAQAAASTPSIDIAKVQWMPGSGKVRVTAWARCGRSMTNASWSISISQEHASAGASTKIRCDGRRHNVSLTLAPKRGRFQPGHAAMGWSAQACKPPYCAALYADGFTKIDRPGKARGPRKHR